MIKTRLRPLFRPNVDKHKRKVEDQAAQFEATLNMALTEESMFELKQGFCRVNSSSSFDDDSFEKVMRTASAMANTGPGAIGYIFFGVADDEADARAIERFNGITTSKHGNFYVTGTQHELTGLGRSLDEMWRQLVSHVENSKLDPELSHRLARKLAPFRYKNHLLWRLEVQAMSKPATYDNGFFERVGPETVEALGSNLVALIQRFPA